MAQTPVDTDVLIVGAGPTGLLLAHECARRGLRHRLVEQHAQPSTHSKALAIFPRTLEILDMAGLATPFLDAANRVTTLAVSTHGKALARIAFAPEDTPYPFIAMVPQNVTEALLLHALHARGARADYACRLVSAEQLPDAVCATLERGGVRETLCARFLVGCDGARSTVRQALGLAFEGGEYHEHFMLADVDTNAALPADALQLCPHGDGPLALFPMRATRWRIVAMVGTPPAGAPTLALTRQLLAERAPVGIEARALHWSSYFTIHHRRTERLHAGRIFIAGDAAHIHSPFGGQGMNTGLQDAWNLACKLDLALHGHGGAALLASYDAERLPVIAGVVRATHVLTRALGTPNRLAQALRAAMIPLAAQVPLLSHALVRRLSELDIRYRGAMIAPGAGQRYFEDSMRAGGIRSRFLLMLGNDTPASVAEQAGRLAGALATLIELRRTARPGLALVRPDGYAALLSAHADTAALAQVQALLAPIVAA